MEMQKAPIQTGPFLERESERSRSGSVAYFTRTGGTGNRFRFWFAAIEFTDDVGANGPRRDLRSLRLLTLAVRLLVSRTDERAFDKDVSAFLDGRGHMLCQAWPEQDDAVPLHFCAPLIIGVLPGALCGEGEDGELRTVAFRFALLRVGTDEPYKCYGIEIGHFLLPFFLPRFSLGHERERGGVESQASVCIVGGNPVLLRAEPTKQKTRRPERRGITRAVSPKKIGEERKQMY